MRKIKLLFLFAAFISLEAWAEDFKNISLNFKNIETQKAFAVIGKFSDRGIVLPDSDLGTTTVHLDKIPWNEAIKAIAKSEKLNIDISGSPIIVSRGNCKASNFTMKKSNRIKDISLTFNNIETRKALSLIADFSERGIILPDSGLGNTTIYLKKLPWNQVLQAIAKAENLDIEVTDSLIIASKAKC